MIKIFIKSTFLVLVGTLVISCSSTENNLDRTSPPSVSPKVQCSDLEKLHRSNGDFKENVLGFIFMIRNWDLQNIVNQSLWVESGLHPAIPPQLSQSNIKALQDTCIKYAKNLEPIDSPVELFIYRFREENSSCVVDNFICSVDSDGELYSYGIETYQDVKQTYHFSDFVKPECKSLISLDNSKSNKYSLVKFGNKTACDCIINTYDIFINKLYPDECTTNSSYIITQFNSKSYRSEYRLFSTVKDLLNLEVSSHNSLDLDKYYNE